MTKRFYAGLTLGIVACVAFIGFIVISGLLTGEYWCEDRSPWWGPPEDQTSSCTGHSWASRHPGEFPWTMPN